MELINIEFVCGNGSHHKKEDRHEWDEDCPITNRWRKAITAIREALEQPEQEPVISKWVLREVYFDEDGEPVMHRSPPQPEQEPVTIKRMKEWIEYLKRKSDFGQHMKIPSEMSAGTCWELALELEQFINTAPSQRKKD